MFATCIANETSALSDAQRGRFADQPTSRAELTIGQRYVVFGLGIWETVLQVLVLEDTGMPMWHEAGLFEVSSSAIPDDWFFTFREGMQASGRDLWTQWVAIWGYEALVKLPDHSNTLMNREPEALALFGGAGPPSSVVG